MTTVDEPGTRISAGSEAWRLMFEYFLSLDPYLDEIAGEFGLSDSQGHALVLLEPGPGVPMHELAERLHCHASNVTAIVDTLEARGLVERRGAEGDRRIKMLALTPAGVELRDQVLELIAAPPAAIAALSPADQRALRDILERAVELLRASG